MKILILLNAPPKSGKNESVIGIDFSELGLTVEEISFAEYIKDKAHELYGLYDIPYDHYEDVKDEPHKDFHGKTPRQAYIHTSEVVLKPKYGKDVVVMETRKRIINSKADIVIVTDLGFDIELDVSAQLDYPTLLLRISRDGYTFEFDSRKYVKVLEKHTVLESYIRNVGTIDELQFKVHDSITRFIKSKDL